VRELENELRKAVALGHDPIVAEGLSPDVLRGAPGPSVRKAARARGKETGEILAAVRGGESLEAALGAAERATIERILEDTRGNRTEAARRLGLSRAGLYKKLQRHGLA
jgi:DNA-binding NtrC family response regulator